MIRYSSVVDKVAVRFAMTAALFFCCIVSSAQTPGKGHELRLGYGGVPAGLALADGLYHGFDVEPVLWFRNKSDRFQDYRGRSLSFGTITLQYFWNFSEKRAIGVNLGWDQVFGKVYDGLTDEVKGWQKSYGIAVYPEFRRTWNPYSKVKVYLAVSAGMGVGCYNNCGRDYEPGKWSYVPLVQLTPVGISFGGKIFGFAELTEGTYLIGIRGGIGYKF